MNDLSDRIEIFTALQPKAGHERCCDLLKEAALALKSESAENAELSTENKNAADTLESLLAEGAAKDAVIKAARKHIEKDDHYSRLDLESALDAVSTQQSLSECPDCGDMSLTPDKMCVSEHCEPDQSGRGICCWDCASDLERVTQMIVCPECGNKRCPRSTHHNYKCTDSNEPGQPGSRYE